MIWLPEPKTRERRDAEAERDRSPLGRSIWAVVRRPRAPVASLIWIYAVGIMAFMAMNGILALFLDRQHGVTEQTIGLFYMYVGGVSLLMRGLLLGPTVRRLGEGRAMLVGIAAMALGFLAIPLTTSIGQLALAAVCMPVGTALLFPATTSLVSRRAPEGETGQTLGVQQSFGGISRLVGPLWAGLAFQFVGIHAPFWISAALMVAVGGFALSLDGMQTGPTPSVETAVEEPPA